MSTVYLSEITKQFGDVTAVNKLDLEIKEGEFFTFLGPSGCGKTTTLRMIAGFYYPTKGKVKFNEKDVTHVSPENRNTGMVFQNYALFPHMTVFGNVAFGLKVRKQKKSVIKQKVEDVLKKVKLEQYSDRQVSQLSGGQQQRVALARALVIEPDILLLDEPLSNLDARLRDDMRTEILRLQRDYGITTIYVTHDQIEALTMSDRIAVFNNGICQQVGTPTEIYNEPVNDFVAKFIGETNLLDVTFDKQLDEELSFYSKGLDKNIIVRDTKENVALYDEGVSLSISVRPEAVRIGKEQLQGQNVLEGKVTFVQFTGEAIHTYVEFPGGQTIKVTGLNGGPNTFLKDGDTVYIEIPANQIRVIPKLGSDT